MPYNAPTLASVGFFIFVWEIIPERKQANVVPSTAFIFRDAFVLSLPSFSLSSICVNTKHESEVI